VFLDTFSSASEFAQFARACCVISTKTFRVSTGSLTSLKNAMRVPRMPSWVFRRT